MMGALELRFFHYIVWPILLLALCRVWFGPPRRLSFAWAFIVAWLLLIHAQAVEVYLYEYRYDSFLVSVWLTPLLVLGTSGPLMRALGHHTREPQGIVASGPPSVRDAAMAKLAPLCTAGVFGLIAVYLFDIGVRNVAFFFAFANPGSVSAGMELRISGLQSNISPVLTAIYSYSRALLLPSYGAVVTALYFSRRIGRAHWLSALSAICLFMVLEAAKSPLATTLVGTLLAAYFARPQRLRLGRMSLLFAIAMFVPALIYPLLSGDRGLDALGVAGNRLWDRLTHVTSLTCAQYFDAFPKVHPYLGPSSNRALAALANVPVVSTPRWVYDRYLDDGTLHGGTVNAAFFATFYADWGMAGVICGGVLVGLTILFLQLYFDRRGPPDAVSVGVHATTMIAVMQLMMSDYYGTALGRGMLSLPILLWCFDVLTRRRRRAPAASPFMRGAGII